MLSISDFLRLRSSLPVIDVRSEGEFDHGHIPGAINIPILSNAERERVGTIYKQQGPKQAIKEGIKLVGPRLSDILLRAEQVCENNEALVHCWRGGMRSGNFCWLVERVGIRAHSLQGGYKSYRTLVQNSFQLPLKLKVLSGSTGSGKTEVLQALERQGEQVICLETLAHHKGSAFGGFGMEGQPTTEQFENDLFETIQKLDLKKTIWIEDESIALGKIFIPQSLWTNMRSSAMVKLDVPKEVRVQRLVADYGKVDKALLAEAIKKITKRLGGQHANDAVDRLMKNDLAATADILLTYYDKAYEKSITSRRDAVSSTIGWDGINSASIAKSISGI
jgi:tRNA 2-selenouridine synthase